jgi:hypothetical protein
VAHLTSTVDEAQLTVWQKAATDPFHLGEDGSRRSLARRVTTPHIDRGPHPWKAGLSHDPLLVGAGAEDAAGAPAEEPPDGVCRT